MPQSHKTSLQAQTPIQSPVWILMQMGLATTIIYTIIMPTFARIYRKCIVPRPSDTGNYVHAFIPAWNQSIIQLYKHSIKQSFIHSSIESNNLSFYLSDCKSIFHIHVMQQCDVWCFFVHLHLVIHWMIYWFMISDGMFVCIYLHVYVPCTAIQCNVMFRRLTQVYPSIIASELSRQLRICCKRFNRNVFSDAIKAWLAFDTCLDVNNIGKWNALLVESVALLDWVIDWMFVCLLICDMFFMLL